MSRHHRPHQQAAAREVAGQVSFHVAQQLGKGTLRVGDVERDNAARALGEHFAVGRLEQDEYDQRLEAVLRARTQGDLMALFRDLPQNRAVVSSRPAVVARHQRSRVPFLPVLLLLVGVAIATGAVWVIWVGLGSLLLAKKIDHDRRRRLRRQGHWA